MPEEMTLPVPPAKPEVKPPPAPPGPPPPSPAERRAMVEEVARDLGLVENRVLDLVAVLPALQRDVQALREKLAAALAPAPKEGS